MIRFFASMPVSFQLAIMALALLCLGASIVQGNG